MGRSFYEASQAKKDEAPSYDYYAENLPQAADWIFKAAVKQRRDIFQEKREVTG